MKSLVSGNISQMTDKELRSHLERIFSELRFILNGNVDLLTNLKVEILDVVFAESYEQVNVRHNLGRVPRGYIVVGGDDARVIFNGPSPNTEFSLNLMSTWRGKARILVF